MKNESGNNATIRDVSRRAGVSVSTVSRVINGSASVRDEPRLRVQKAIEELNYKPSYSARLLKTQKSYSVFILVPEINNPYFTDIYHGTRVTMEAHGYMAFLFEAINPDEVLKSITSRGADGVILDARYVPQAEAILNRMNIPFTVFNTPAQFGIPNSVRINLYDTLFQLATRLYDAGHRSIAFVADRTVDKHPHDRYFALEAAAKARGMPFRPQLVHCEDHPEDQFACGYFGFRRLLDLPQPPDAAVAINDLAAIGAMAAAQEAGLNVPRDVAVVGFDNSPAGRYAAPRLSTVNLPTGKQGELAAEMLLKLMDDPESETYSVTLDTEIMLRDSTRHGM